ncbi:MAG TPA: N-acyl-D-glucosamine 2-epimerase, partial [Parafilimonas sp.]
MNCLQQYKKESKEELISILDYWMHYTIDDANGGFYGKANNDNIADENAPKGSVMYARILWAFSSAYNFCGNEKYFITATRA